MRKMLFIGCLLPSLIGAAAYIDTAKPSLKDTFVSEADEKLLQTIRTKLAKDFFHQFDNISVEVTNGVVILYGLVSTQDDAQSVEYSITGLVGVKEVKNRLQISLEGQIIYKEQNVNDSFSLEADHQIVLQIRGKLRSQYGRKYEGLLINSSDGIVTITGAVELPEEVPLLLSFIASFSGVVRVNNKLTVTHGPSFNFEDNQTLNPRDSYTTSEDRQIILDIRTLLSDKYDDIALFSDFGTVRISGRVPTKADADWILNTASHIMGVIAVNDRLLYDAQTATGAKK